MSALRAALFEWNLRRITRVVVAAVAVFLALRVTDGFFTGIGATMVFLVVLSIPWELAERLAARPRDS